MSRRCLIYIIITQNFYLDFVLPVTENMVEYVPVEICNYR